MELKEKAVRELAAIVGEEQVISDGGALKASDPIMVRMYEKAYGNESPFYALCCVYAQSEEEVSRVLAYCNKNDIHVISRTGASSSEDQLLVTDDRTIYLDGSRMDRILRIDTENMVAEVECGVSMETFEAAVNEMGLTTGHCPQSRPLACIGGLAATRSIGQFSTYYGGIEDLVCGMKAVLPDGKRIEIRPVPRRAAGPDLRHLLMGSEGAWAFITELTVKLFPYHPQDMWMGGYIIKDFPTGIRTIREIMVKGYKPSVVRLYDKADVDENYGSVKLKEEEAFLFFTAEGPADVANVTGEAIDRIVRSRGAEYIGTKAVEHWFETRNNICKVIGTEYDYKRFRETGVYNSTIEICADWTDIEAIYEEAMRCLPERIPALTMLGGHVSHSYINGTNVYFVYAMRIDDPREATEEIHKFINVLCDIVLKYHSGTIVHHHGVGKVRVGRIREELGSSYEMLRRLKEVFDPHGIMNPGCLLPLEEK